MVRWPGHIKADATTFEIATTYDIYPTVLSLAGGTLPTDRTFDGKDLSSMLMSGGASPHECVFHWHDSQLKNGGEGLSAVRCGDMKAHFYTQGDYAKQANRTKSWPVGKQDPPLLFNLTADPTETENIDPKSAEYEALLKKISSARDAHVASIVPVCSQDKPPCGGNDVAYAVCGDPNSKAKYPQWPKCTISPDNWAAKSCV
jgi:arylsulfatase A-like enzyme